MRASLGGNQVRVRISNACGQRPLALGSVHIALRDTGPAIVASSDRELSFGGATTVTIAAGAVLFSDPVALDLPPLADLAVSLYLPGEILNNFQITGRYARQTNYVSPPGDFSEPKCRVSQTYRPSARNSPGGISSNVRDPLHRTFTGGLPFIRTVEKIIPLGSFFETTRPW